jgi:uncharacterized protein YqgQ
MMENQNNILFLRFHNLTDTYKIEMINHEINESIKQLLLMRDKFTKQKLTPRRNLRIFSTENMIPS